MAAVPVRALTADKRWAAAAAPTRRPGAGVLGTAPKPTNLPSQRADFTWANKLMPPESNAWGSSSLPSLNSGGGSGLFSNINDRPSGGSSSSSTTESDLLDSPLDWGQKSYPMSASDALPMHNPTTMISHHQSTESRSGSLQFSYFKTSFSEVLKGPSRTIVKQGPTSREKGFTLSADEFPTLVSKNSESNSQQGRSSQGPPSVGSGSVAAQDEQRKMPVTGDDPVPTTNFPRNAQQVQLHGTQAPNMCMPPPWPDFWHPRLDHPPDRNGMWHRGASSYGPCKAADTPGSSSVESFTHNGQSLLNQGGEARHGPAHGCYLPENRDSCYVHVPADICVRSLPHHIHGKVKDNHSDTLEKQPVIKKDVVLLEKIRLLNIKARNLHARSVSEISSCRESMVERPKSIDSKEDHVAKDIPFSAVTVDIASAFDMANLGSEGSNFLLNGPSNVSANHVTVDLSEGHGTEFSEARKPGKYADYHTYGGGDTSRNRHGSSTMDIAPNICGHGWKEHSTVDSLPVVITNTHQDQSFPGNSSHQVHVRTDDDMLNSPDYEIQHSRRELSAQHAKQLQEEERTEIQQKVKPIAELEELKRGSFVQSKRSNDAPIEADKIHRKQRAGSSGTTKHDTSTSDTCCIVYAENHNMSLKANGIKISTDSISFTSASDTSGVNIGPLIHNIMPSAKKTDINLMEHTAQKSAEQSHYTSAPKHLLMENRRRQVQSWEGISRERSSISGSSNFVLNGPSNVSANGVVVDLSEGHVTEFSEARKPGKSADYHTYGGRSTSTNRRGISAKDIASNTCGHGWEEHYTVDSLPVMTNTHQDQSFTENSSQQLHVRTADYVLNSPGYEIQHSRRRNLTAQHAEQLQEEDIGKVQQKEKSIAKLEELSRHSFLQSRKSNDAPIRDKIHLKKAGGSGTTKHDTSTPDTCCIVYAENLNVPVTENGAKNTTVSTSSSPASEIAGVNRGPLIHNVMPSAKVTEINMMEYIAQKSSPDTSAPKHLSMENRQRQVYSQERILKDRSNIAESTEYVTDISVAGTIIDSCRAEAKPHLEISIQNKNRKPASPRVSYTENTEASNVRKTHLSGVIINNSIIPVPVASVRGFAVGRIVLGDVSLASVNQEETVVEEVDETITSCASQQAKNSGKNQHGLRHVKDQHGNDSVTRTPFKEPSKKGQSEAGSLNCTAIPAPTQPSGNHIIVRENEVPTKRSDSETSAHKPAYKEQDLQNLRQVLPAENHTTFCGNQSASKLVTKSRDKAAADTPTATKAKVETEPESRQDKKISRHLGRSSASSDQVSTNRSASVLPDLTEQAANSLVVKIMQELSDQSRTHDATLAGNTREKLPTSHNQRQFHVDVQGNVWSNLVANSYMDRRGMTLGLCQGAALPTAHLLPGPISLAPNNALGNSVLGWTWDPAEGILISDMGNLPGSVTTTINTSVGELIQNVGWGDTMGLHDREEVIADMAAYQAANPGVQYHTVMEPQQLNQAWYPQAQHDGRYPGGSGPSMYMPECVPDAVRLTQHHSAGTGVFWPEMATDARMLENLTAAGPTAGRHFEYRPEPGAPPGGVLGWSQGHPPAAWTALYLEQIYYV